MGDCFTNHLESIASILDALFSITSFYDVPFLALNMDNQTQSKTQNRKITEFLHLNYHRDLTIKEVANHFGYNPSYFSRLFKRSMGMTYSDYLSSLRLQAATTQLRETDMSVLDIALTNGFSTKSLNHALKKKYNLTPVQYRRTYSL